MFKRLLLSSLKERLVQFPVVTITGPRQSGKTTLLENLTSQYAYYNLESPEQFLLFQEDPKTFLTDSSKRGVIIDEAQKLPELFSYIQVIADQRKEPGQFILSGSQNFLLNQHITQSLAGRTAILELLPLSYPEFITLKSVPRLTIWEWLFQGGYPRPYHDNIPIKTWMSSYIRTYLERDVRSLLQIKDLALFQKFLHLCAGRHGQLLNYHQLAIDAGISHTTVMNWISILEASYIIFRLQPFHQNFNKRVIKSPKLYFYDSGLVSYLLGVDSPRHLSMHASRGAIFEGYILSEIIKHFLNRGEESRLYFWRDSHGNEIDCIMEQGEKITAIEIKSTTTFRPELLRALKQWQKISGEKPENCQLIYAGETPLVIHDVNIIPWNQV